MRITQLSSDIIVDSTRVSGLDDVSARLLDIVCTIKPQNSDSSIHPTELSSLSTQRKSLEDERAVLVQETQVLAEYARTLNSQHVDPSAATGFLDTFVKRRIATLARIQQLDDQIASLQQRIKTLVDNHKGRSDAQVVVLLSTSKDCKIELILTYRKQCHSIASELF